MSFCVSLGHFDFVLLVLLGLVFSVPSQEIGWEERLRSDPFCFEWDGNNHLTACFPGQPGYAGTRKVKPIWILLEQETVSGSGISWAICKSAPRSRQITMPVPHHSVFYKPDALPAAQATASKHWSLALKNQLRYICKNLDHIRTVYELDAEAAKRWRICSGSAWVLHTPSVSDG